MRNDLEIQAVIGNLESKDLEPKIKEGLQNLGRELMAINDHFQRELYKIKMDGRYTAMGRDVLTQQLGDGVLEKILPYKNAYGDLIRNAQNSLLGPKKERSQGEILLDYLKNQELRSMYNVSSMDALEIEAQIDDPAFLEAIVTSPMPLLPPDRLNELIQKRAEMKNPEVAKLLDEYGFCAGTIRSLANTIKADVKASGWKDAEQELAA
jgi:hypothetical protein